MYINLSTTILNHSIIVHSHKVPTISQGIINFTQSSEDRYSGCVSTWNPLAWAYPMRKAYLGSDISISMFENWVKNTGSDPNIFQKYWIQLQHRQLHDCRIRTPHVARCGSNALPRPTAGTPPGSWDQGKETYDSIKGAILVFFETNCHTFRIISR